MFNLVVLFLFCNCYLVKAVDFTDCGSGFTIEGEINVNGCSNPDQTCTLLIGGNTTVSFTINSGSTWDQVDGDLVNDVALYVRGTKFLLSVNPLDPCEEFSCPILKNYQAPYVATVYVSAEYEPVYAQFKWVMKSSLIPDTLICFYFPVLIAREL